MKKNGALVLLVLALLTTRAPNARAVSLGDAALTVAVSTGAGALLGASTLPFYKESGEHSKNIFYGAAVGAVIGVFISAAAGVTDPNATNDDADARIKRQTEYQLAQRARLAPDFQPTTNLKKGETQVWSPLAKLSF